MAKSEIGCFDLVLIPRESGVYSFIYSKFVFKTVCALTSVANYIFSTYFNKVRICGASSKMNRPITQYLTTGLLGLAVCLLIGACHLTPESGQFYCKSKDDCPRDWICRPDEDGQNRCYDDIDQDGSDSSTETETGNDTDSESNSEEPPDSESETDLPKDTGSDSDTDTIETDTIDLPPCPNTEFLFCKNPSACKSPNVPNPGYRCDKENEVCCDVS